MTWKDIDLIPNAGFFTAFVHEDHIDVLIRSADWYNLPPIQRFLYNMAASLIRMEDAKTETRVYTFERYDYLRQLLHLSADQEWEAAWEAWMLWGDGNVEFGVVHMDLREGHRGNLLVGDDPMDVGEFVPDVEPGTFAEALQNGLRKAKASAG